MEMLQLRQSSSFWTPSVLSLPSCAHLRNGEPTPAARAPNFRCFTVAKAGNFPFNLGGKRCESCSGKGAIECPGCKGTGKNKKNGNIFERWKCFECQGFGLKSCPSCGKGGLTPEQRGER